MSAAIWCVQSLAGSAVVMQWQRPSCNWGACKAHNVRHVQVGFKRELIKEVRLFVLDAQEFRQDWEANGPMVPGLDPMDAVDRLKKFQLMFEVCTYMHYSIICV